MGFFFFIFGDYFAFQLKNGKRRRRLSKARKRIKQIFFAPIRYSDVGITSVIPALLNAFVEKKKLSPVKSIAPTT